MNRFPLRSSFLDDVPSGDDRKCRRCDRRREFGGSGILKKFEIRVVASIALLEASPVRPNHSCSPPWTRNESEWYCAGFGVGIQGTGVRRAGRRERLDGHVFRANPVDILCPGLPVARDIGRMSERVAMFIDIEAGRCPPERIAVMIMFEAPSDLYHAALRKASPSSASPCISRSGIGSCARMIS